ncbi:MAG: crotonase/enoyl-CoA hydratase family protein [Janthinobacterium lividum]
MTSSLKLETRDGVLIMTLDRPQARNAIDFELAKEIAAAVDELDSRDDLRLGILTGAGGTFCAGMDLKSFLAGKPRAIVAGRGFGGLTEAPPRKTLIAAIEGFALAGGFELALSCDLLVASREAKFGLPEVKRGLVAAAGGLVRLPRRLPFHIAMELALTGDMITAERAHSYGLINRLVDAGGALDAALELAKSITANGPLAVAVSKRVIVESADWASSEMFAKQGAITAPVFASADAREGAAAFAEKRPPKWTGK